MNIDDPEAVLYRAERRVLEIQTKLHHWAGDDPHRRFDDLYNLVTYSGFLLVAWARVRNNRVHARLEWTVKPPAISKPSVGWTGSSGTCGLI